MSSSGKDFIAPDLLARIERSERDGGLFLRDIPEGSLVSVYTKNSVYTIAVIDVEKGKIAMEGNKKYLPTPEVCILRGSTWGSSMIKVDWIGKGMHLEVGIPGGLTLTTSVIRLISIEHYPARAKEMIEAALKKQSPA